MINVCEDIDLNIYELFTFLNKIDNQNIPINLKLLYSIPLDNKDLKSVLNNHILMSDIKRNIKLPNNFECYALDLENSNITELPKDLTVTTYIDISNTRIQKIPNDLIVECLMFIDMKHINDIPKHCLYKLKDIVVEEDRLKYFQEKYPDIKVRTPHHYINKNKWYDWNKIN